LVGVEFPKDFSITVKAIFKHLFRIFCHIYTAHSDKIEMLQLEGHLNTLFSHFYCFGKEFDLIDKKDIIPLQDFIQELEGGTTF
jgi:MOB kinase activator 1